MGAASLLGACSYTNASDSAPTPCDLPQSVSYQANVLPILTTNCRNACHNPQLLQGNFNMDDFNQVHTYSTTGLNGVSYMLGNIRHDPGFNPMPQVGTPLSPCEIATIKAWIDAGALQN